MITTLPLSLSDVAPGPGFSRISPARNWRGLVEGVYTGGPWLSPDGEYWKPLDALPYVNAPHRIETSEADCLDDMAFHPLFPKNWRVETANGRRWLVRPEAWMVDDRSVRDLDRSQALLIEDGVRALNRRGWGIGDHISLAFDSDDRLFLLDLSNASQFDPAVDDTRCVLAFWQWAGFTDLACLREAGRSVAGDPLLLDYYGFPATHKHIYASRSRPISGTWATIPDACYLGNDPWLSEAVYTWVLVPAALEDGILERYELTWAWSPIR